MKKILSTLDLVILSLMIVSLPSLEAPKYFFLVLYLVTRFITEVIRFREGIRSWGGSDTLFATIICTALLSTVFAGFSGLEEWRGLKVLLSAILSGWALSRANYSKNDCHNLFMLIIIGTILPLIYGIYEYLVIQSKPNLQLHSVGHVNHSAIYLVMIFGASLGWFLSNLKITQETLRINFQSILLGILSLLFFISLIIGQSRGAFAIATILGVFLILLLGKNKIIKITGILAIIGILLLTVTLKTNIIQKQIINSENNNVLAFRDRVWNVSLEASRFYPLLGIGMSNWHFITLDHLKESVESREGKFNKDKYYLAGHSHNLYLTALVERGIIGLFITFLFMIAWFKQLMQTFYWAKKIKQASYLWAGSFSAWFATFGIGLVNTTFHHEHAILACMLLGLYLSYTRYHFKN